MGMIFVPSFVFAQPSSGDNWASFHLVPDCPSDYHELIALLAAQDGFIKDGRPNELIVKKIAEYERDMDIDAQERRQDMSREIRESGDSGNGGFVF